MPTRLRERLAALEESRSLEQPLLDGESQRLGRSSGVADRREPSQKHLLENVRSPQVDKLGWRPDEIGHGSYTLYARGKGETNGQCSFCRSRIVSPGLATSNLSNEGALTGTAVT